MADHDAELKARWRTSTYSSPGDCVEVAILTDVTYVRNSRNSAGARLTFPTASWTEFLGFVIPPSP
jgi:hypothetical protein